MAEPQDSGKLKLPRGKDFSSQAEKELALLRSKIPWKTIERLDKTKIFALVGGIIVLLAGGFYALGSSGPMLNATGIIEEEPLPVPVEPSLPPVLTVTPLAFGTPTPRAVIAPPTVATAAPTPVPPPLISSVSNHSITSESASVSWFTDVPSTSRVVYGTAALNESAESPGNSTTHYVKLNGLIPNTTYNFAVASCVGATCRYVANYSFRTNVLVLEFDGIEVSPVGRSIFINESIQFEARLVLKNGTRMRAPDQVVSWNSSNSSIGFLNASGFFKPTGVGSAIVNVSANASAATSTTKYVSSQAQSNTTGINVLKAFAVMSISLIPSSPVLYGTAVSASCSSSVPQVAPILSRDGVSTGGAGETMILGVGSYSYSCTASDTSNYSVTAGSVSLFVNKAKATPKLLVNGSEWTMDTTWSISKGFYNANFSHFDATSVSTDSDCQFNSYCTFYTTGTFTFIANNAGDANHTAASVFRYLTINP